MQQQPTGGGQYGVPDFVNSSANRPSPQPHMLGISEPQSQPSHQHTLQPQQQQPQQNIMQSRPPPPPQQLQHSSPPKGLDSISDSQSPISQRNIQSQTQNAQSTQSQQRSAFEQQLQLVPNNSFGDHDDAVLAAEDGERGPVGNRWPRQETLALLKIRSDMDAAFRDASLKGPLWEDVSRKLEELGYHRSAKKCKEKFENVQKYYKRTKDGRAGRQDGKSYRFFTQLEALHNNNSGNPMTTTSAPNTTSHMNQSSNNPRVNVSNALTMTLAQPPRPIQMTASQPFHTAPSHPVDLNPGPINSGMDMKSLFMYKPTFSSSSESSDDEYEEQTDSRKRKRSSSGTAKKMMTFFEQLIKQIMERQEMMQQKFLEAIEKREQDRMIREEAWKRQEMARLNREHEIMAQERSLAASRDAAFIAFLQKITGQTIQIPIVPPLAQSTTTVTTVPAMNETHNSRAETTTTAIQVHHQHHHGQHHGHHQQQQHHHQQDVMNTEQNDLSSFDPGSSRWPKPEVHALIRLRSSMESRYQDAGPKGPLWEEISNGMSKLGYNRSAKRCKEKWENINKYFKKVKESNKKRPEDAKTCPYFHQLDQLYKRKQMNQTPKLEHPQQQQLHNENPQDQQLPASGEKVQESQQQNSSHEILAIMPPPNPENKTANAQSSNQPTIPTSNGTTMQTTFYTSPDHGEKKQESLNMMDVMVDMEALQTEHSNQPQQQQQQRHAPPAVEDYDTDKMDADEDDEDEEDEDEDDSENTSDQDPHQHHIQQHRHAIPAPIAHDQRTMEHLPFAQFVHETRNPAQNTAAATAAASSFMAMVHRLTPTENPEFKSSKA